MENEEVKELFKSYFKDKEGEPFQILDYQISIANSVLEEKEKRIIINATTRSGKSLILALSSILYALSYKGRGILLVAPTFKQTRIIMDYIAEHISDSPWISEMVDINRTESPERLKKEVSKNRITFRNGSQISLVSAEGKGERLMGLGADLIIEDEAELVSDEVYRAKIKRMLGDSPDSKLILIGNAIGQNHFYQASFNPEFKHIHISWKECVEERRLSQEFIEEQRKSLTEQEFAMLYQSTFQEDLETKLISKVWIDRATEDIDYRKSDKTSYGLDVAEMGTDFTVLTGVERENDIYKVTYIKSWSKMETMPTAGKVAQIAGKQNKIVVDATGIGNGVWSRLKEQNYQTQKLLVGSSPTAERQRFANLKAQIFWNLRNLFEEGKIKIPNEPKLVRELNELEYEITSSGKIKIKDPEKSPDFADSLAYAIAGLQLGTGGVWYGTVSPW